MKEKSREAVLSAEELQTKVSSMTKRRYAFTAKCKDLALDVQCVPGLVEEVRSLRLHVPELEKASMTKVAKVRAKLRDADMEVAAEMDCTERAKHTARVAPLEGDLHDLKDELDFSECRNRTADLWYFILSDEFD